MQLAALNLGDSESCIAEISTNGGKRWQALLTVTPEMADGVTLHTQSGQLKNSGSIETLMLRYRANGEGKPAVRKTKLRSFAKEKVIYHYEKLKASLMRSRVFSMWAQYFRIPPL